MRIKWEQLPKMLHDEDPKSTLGILFYVPLRTLFSEWPVSNCQNVVQIEIPPTFHSDLNSPPRSSRRNRGEFITLTFFVQRNHSETISIRKISVASLFRHNSSRFLPQICILPVIIHLQGDQVCPVSRFHVKINTKSPEIVWKSAGKGTAESRRTKIFWVNKSREGRQKTRTREKNIQKGKFQFWNR